MERWFPDATQIGYMGVSKVTEPVQPVDGRSTGRQPVTDEGVELTRRAVRISAAEKRLARVVAISSDLEPVGTGGNVMLAAIIVWALCAMSRPGGVNSGTSGCSPAARQPLKTI